MITLDQILNSRYELLDFREVDLPADLFSPYFLINEVRFKSGFSFLVRCHYYKYVDPRRQAYLCSFWDDSTPIVLTFCKGRMGKDLGRKWCFSSEGYKKLTKFFFAHLDPVFESYQKEYSLFDNFDISSFDIDGNSVTYLFDEG